MDPAIERLVNAGVATTEDGSMYEGQGDTYDRVTHIISKVMPPYLVPWAEKVGIEAAHTMWSNPAFAFGPDGEPPTLEDLKRAIKDAGLDCEAQKQAGGVRGAEIHFAVEAWVKQGVPPNLDDFEPESRPFAQSLCQFLVDYQPEFEVSELTVFHPEMRYAGTIDAIGKFKAHPKGARHPDQTGKRLIVDFKTNMAKRVYDTHYMQLAAYRTATDFHGIKIDGEAVVAIGPFTTKGKPYRVAPNFYPARVWPPAMAFFRALEEAKSLNPNTRSK